MPRRLGRLRAGAGRRATRHLAARTHGPRDGRRLALTFDDGPGRVTEAVLEALARNGARATFNLLGDRIAGREALVRRIVAEGHEVGSHAFHHDRLARRPVEAYRQLRRTTGLIGEVTGNAPRVFRPPYGSVSPSVVLTARLAGLVTVRWDVDPHDYETPGADVIERRVIRRARPGSIVLLHDDRRALEQTAEALEGICGELGRRGYEFVTLSELLGLGSGPRGDRASGTVRRMTARGRRLRDDQKLSRRDPEQLA